MSGNSTSFNTSSLNATMVLPFEMYLWPAGVAFLVCGGAGLFGNIMIMAALFTSPELKKNRCNILVGNLACCDAVSSICIALAGVHGITTSAYGFGVALPQDICYFVSIPVIISFDAGALMILAIGVDRAISLWHPVYYKTLSSKYTIAANGICWIFGLMQAILGFFYKSHDDMIPICIMPAARRGLAFVFWNDSNIIINILVVITYGAAYSKAKRLSKVASTNNEQILRKNRLLTSLVICVCVYIVCWMVTMFVVFLVNTLGVSPSIAFHSTLYIGILATINVGCNFYVYCTRSDEYRRAFKKVLGYESKNSSVAPSNNVIVSTPVRGRSIAA